MSQTPIKLLLIDDDEDSYLLTRDVVSRIEGHAYELDWAGTYQQGLDAICCGEHTVYLVDYQLDGRNGLELITQAMANGCSVPMIMLSGHGDHAVDVRATEAGAADFLVKDELTPRTLERSVRYSMEQHRLRVALEQRVDQLRALAAQLTRAEHRERRRIAQLLHDHLQQMLVAIKMRLEGLHTVPDEHQPTVTGIRELLDQVFEAARTLTVELSPPILHDTGLAGAIHWLSRWMQDKHGLIVKVKTDPEIDEVTDDLRTMLFQSVRELLFNVVKHAGVNEAHVHMTYDNENMRITVTDEGAGFMPNCLDQPRPGGSDFGLIGVRERFHLLGGDIQIDSAPGQGCRVTLLAPIRAAAKEMAELADAEDVTQRLTPTEPLPALSSTRRTGTIRVLLADDHRILREGLMSLLSAQSDIEVVGEACDGNEAIDMAERLRPDVVIMDVSMPHLSGIDATRRIKAEHPKVRVIGLSTYGAPEMAQSMLDVGATAYLSKGGPVDLLVAHIRDNNASTGSCRATNGSPTN